MNATISSRDTRGILDKFLQKTKCLCPLSWGGGVGGTEAFLSPCAHSCLSSHAISPGIFPRSSFALIGHHRRQQRFNSGSDSSAACYGRRDVKHIQNGWCPPWRRITARFCFLSAEYPRQPHQNTTFVYPSILDSETCAQVCF